MENILENVLLSQVYTVVTWLLTAIGMYKIFTKCKVNGIWGFVPGLRYYRLAEISGREVDGICVVVIGALSYLARYWLNTHPDDEQNAFVLAIFTIAMLMAIIVYELRVISGLAKVFDLKKRWVVFWALMPWLAALIWGFSKNIQPVNLDLFEQEAMMAGSEPALLAGGSPLIADRDHGLYVNVKDRKVRSGGKRRYLLKDIVFSLPNGSMTLVLGGSGAGKTTLINAILGYEKANAEIRLNGKDVYKNYSEMKYKIGFVPQQDLLRLNDTVRDTLKDAAKMRLPTSMTGKQRDQRVSEVMDILGLTAGKDGLVSKKSGGMRKRISIGTALISDPDLFVLDEPDSGLDGVIARELFEKLRSVADSGKIVLVITHTPDRVIDMFDNVVVLARDSGRVGRLAYCGPVKDAYEFFGADSMEHIVRIVNAASEGGEGRADEMIGKFIQQRQQQTESEAA